MPNGKPGDHPLTDIVVHRSTVFGAPYDDLIREIAPLATGPAHGFLSELVWYWPQQPQGAVLHGDAFERVLKAYLRMLRAG
jgi:hypothetical protein